SARAQRAQDNRAKQIEKLRERVARFDLSEIGHIRVSYHDSRKAGNCHEGTLAFIDTLFDDGRREATILEVVTRIRQNGGDLDRLATSERGRQFVAACLHAIRRHRREGSVLETAA